MATIIVKVQGGQPKELNATTLGEAKTLMSAANYQASINGLPVSDVEYELSDYDVVTLTEQVKGA